MTPENIIANEILRGQIVSTYACFGALSAVKHFRRGSYRDLNTLLNKTKLNIKLATALRNGATVKQLCETTGLSDGKIRTMLCSFVSGDAAKCNRDKRPFIYTLSCTKEEFFDVDFIG